MSWIEGSVLLFGGLVAVMGLGLPVAFAFLVLNVVGAMVFLGGEAGLVQLARNAVASITSFSLTPIPFFVLMGEVLFHTGVALKAIDAFALIIRRVPARLSVIAIVAGTVFSAISGSTIATTALPGVRLGLTFALVVGAMPGGFATPTEAAAIGAAGTILAAALYRSLTWANLMQALTSTVAVSGTVLFIIIGATTFAQVLSFSGAVNGLLDMVTAMDLSANALVIAMLLILLFLGCFVDQVSMMLITLPFFMPLVQRYDVDQIWFVVLFLICMQLGLLTPPFGLLLFTMNGVAPASITMHEVYMAAMPYIAISLVILVLIFFFPVIATWLPAVLSR